MVAGGALKLQGAREQGGRGGEATVARWAWPWRQGFPCRHSVDADRGGPLSGFSPFFQFQNFQQIFVFN